MKKTDAELPVIQKAHDLIVWYVPLLNKLPRDHKHMLGDRIITGLYEVLEGLIRARYAREKRAQLEAINVQLELLRRQTRLLLDFKLIDAQRFAHAANHINEVGVNLGGWLKQQKAI